MSMADTQIDKPIALEGGRKTRKNLTQARQPGGRFWLELDEAWRPGLTGLAQNGHIIVLYWMGRSRRDLVLQRPRHKPSPTGVFALRSPVRPNPVALAVVKVLAIDQQAGRVDIDAIDCLDGTGLVDIKPWLASIDIPPGGAPSGQG